MLKGMYYEKNYLIDREWSRFTGGPGRKISNSSGTDACRHGWERLFRWRATCRGRIRLS